MKLFLELLGFKLLGNYQNCLDSKNFSLVINGCWSLSNNGDRIYDGHLSCVGGTAGLLPPLKISS